MSEQDDSLPRLLGGRYRLEARLGSGGMGVVYRATDLTMFRPVAVKVVGGDGVELDEEVAGRFLREAKNTARVQHENIIEVYDFGRSEQGDMFFVMELLDGESLSAKLRREGKLTAEVGVHIARQMCAALHVAHAAGIIHRDLKPANVMLIERAGHRDYVKVLDFGVAKSYTADQETQLTHTGMLVGTIDYMAPEQIMGRTVDGRTDIYALGVLMYRMFTGRAPFRDGGVPALIHAHLNLYAKPMTDIVSELPGELDRVVLRCLAKKPEQRFESMAEVSRALAGAIESSESDSGIVDVGYDEEDPYDSGDQTAVAKPGGASLPPERAPSEPPDDATIRVDRPPGGLPFSRPPRPRSERPPVLYSEPAIETTVVMARDEVTAKRPPVPDEVMRLEASGPRECAMCRTFNAPHARACAACGVSLASQEQEAVRARVVVPRTAHLSAPQMPPPTSGAHPAPFPPFGQGQGAHGMHHPHGVQAANRPQAPAWGPAVPSAQASPPPASMWQRLLSWAGLRGR
jgi:serine/threonine-protein kinase